MAGNMKPNPLRMIGVLLVLLPIVDTTCRDLSFAPPFYNKRLVREPLISEIDIESTEPKTVCEQECWLVEECVAINILSLLDGKYRCELLERDRHQVSQHLFKEEPGSIYVDLMDPCRLAECRYNCIRLYKKSTPYLCAPIALTCRDMKTRYPLARHYSGHYIIDPDGDGETAPFTVYCDMVTRDEIGVTVIGHDSEERTHVTGYESPGSYKRIVTYNGANLYQLKALTAKSTSCQQFIKYECRGSTFRYSNGLTADHWWVSRDGAKMTSWGGAPRGSGKCACGVDSSCVRSNKNCNCDANENAWLEDSGLLTYKDDLPVTQLRFGDTGASTEEGYHTLGKLECF